MLPDQPGSPARYLLRVRGRLDDHWAAWFGDLTLTQDGDGTTTLTGPVSDQAELHGLLSKIRDLGVTLICVQELAPAGSRSAERGHLPQP